MEEEELIARAMGGDGGAFNELLVRYQGLAYSVAYRILGDQADAADAAQDAFLSAYQAVRRFRGGSFRAWLMRIVTNACYDSLRRAQRRPTVSLEAGDDPGWHECLADPGELPEAMAERHDLSMQVQRALGALPPEQRAVLVLSDLHGLPYAEIAYVLRLPLGTVRSRLSRARRVLRDRLLQDRELPSAWGLDPPGLSSGGPDPLPLGRSAVLQQEI